jgi:hypothetical protein
MDLKRRLQLYLLGLVLGGLMAWAFFGKRLSNTAWMPEDRIKLRLKTTLLKAHPTAEAQMAQWPTDLNAVRASIDNAEVLFKETRRSGDSLYYSIQATVAERKALLTVLAFRDYRADSTATLWELKVR